MTTYFHGTNADLPIGAVLLPGEQLGVSMNHGRSKHVYMTTDTFTEANGKGRSVAVREALAWARTACMVEEEEDDDAEPYAFVYIVQPLGDVEPDSSEDVGEEAVRTSHAVIIGVVEEEELYDYLPAYGKSYLS